MGLTNYNEIKEFRKNFPEISEKFKSNADLELFLKRLNFGDGRTF